MTRQAVTAARVILSAAVFLVGSIGVPPTRSVCLGQEGSLKVPALDVTQASRATLPAAAQNLTGKRSTVNGASVLTLWGGAYERGYAHGFLMADDIMGLLESCLLDERVLKDPATYESNICGRFLSWMDFGEDRLEELQGMHAGITAAVGEKKTRLERLGRNLTLKDLQAINTLADWNGFFCSSFSVWGKAAEKGEMITGRNLDFLDVPGAREKHLIIVYREPGEGRKRWVSVAWPGLIGAYTAMNEDGVTIALHDSQALPPRHGGPFKPRSLVLREAIERACGETALTDVLAVLRKSPVIRANNVHVSGPFVDPKTQPDKARSELPCCWKPAAVFEYDADEKRQEGVTERLAADNTNKTLTQAVLCTNHYRKRARPTSCNRYDAIETALADAARQGRKIDLAAARAILEDVSVPGTLHSAVFLPGRKEFHLGLATPAKNGAEVESARFKLTELFAK